MALLLKQYYMKLNKDKILLLAFAVIYFFVLLKYYLVDYYVPDFRLYFDIALQGAKARDGFSSLFIWFASFAASCPKVLILLCLLLMAVSLANISFFIYDFLKNSRVLCCLSVVLLYSSGHFYYVYGKLFYDFPFTVFTFSLCLLALHRIYVKLDKRELPQKEWFVFCLLLGFCFSWKPYNIFCIAGIGLLLFTKTCSRKLVIFILKSLKKICVSLICFAAGYVVGNFNLILYPQETIAGIRAYPAQYDIWLFLTGKGRYIWDHINDLPFNISTIALAVVVLLMFLLPLIYRKWSFLLISIFMWTCFYLYITFFSPGYTWHGFTMGLFINIYIVFLFSELLDIKIRSLGFILISIAVFIQCITCFAYYLPLQDYWHSKTVEAVNVLEKNESEIFADVCFLASQIADDKYTIDLLPKRYKPVGVKPTSWNLFSMDNIYCAATNYVFLDPLRATNYSDWDFLESNGNLCDDAEVDYVIWIVPDAMKAIRDVADLYLYYNCTQMDFIHKNGYSIYLLKRVN